ncbi:type II toxin-antitoxin system RelE/ParE family toxin [Longimicrobium sp.]|jgi:proteic killer suppression protein|uniref:type II toxin-antitoxin system RelE/ParE family toxin n=1 Tax=Longimicrobium sp. TaxID=2029185 RepID=UPI002EDB69CA
MIVSFRDQGTYDVSVKLDTRAARRTCPPILWPSARARLERLQRANRLQDLRTPSGNRLEALQGNRFGQYSIRINDQYRVCFRWEEGGAGDVEIVDYH